MVLSNHKTIKYRLCKRRPRYSCDPRWRLSLKKISIKAKLTCISDLMTLFLHNDLCLMALIHYSIANVVLSDMLLDFISAKEKVPCCLLAKWVEYNLQAN